MVGYLKSNKVRWCKKRKSKQYTTFTVNKYFLNHQIKEKWDSARLGAQEGEF